MNESPRFRMLFLVLTVSAAIGVLGVVGTIVYLDHQAQVADAQQQRRERDHLATVQAVDAWARYDSALAACRRGNDLRRKVNSLADAVRGVNELLVEYFDSSAAFRQRSGQPGLAKEAAEARETIRDVAEHVTDASIVHCQVVIPAPLVLRPAKESQ